MSGPLRLALLTALATSAGCYFDFTSGSDAAVADGAVIDGAVIDASPADGAPFFDAEPVPDAFITYFPAYTMLSETGLYEDIDSLTAAGDVVEFEPVYKLWSDNAGKRRWIWLPPGGVIDTSDMDHWRFPPSTKVWKLFTRDSGAGTVMLETRLIERSGVPQNARYMMAFYWGRLNGSGDWLDPQTSGPCIMEDMLAGDYECDAIAVPNGVQNASQTTHDIPAAGPNASGLCLTCHGGEANNFLGFQAIQLSHGTPLPQRCPDNTNDVCPTVTTLRQAGLLSDPPPMGVEYPAPGASIPLPAPADDFTQADLLGYMHANCGHCHNPGPANATGCYATTNSVDPPVEGYHTRLYVADSGGDPMETAAWRTTFGVDGCGAPVVRWLDGEAPSLNDTCTETPPDSDIWECDITIRGVPGDAVNSAVYHRIASRDFEVQMPPIATELVDPDAEAMVEAWIDNVTPCP